MAEPVKDGRELRGKKFVMLPVLFIGCLGWRGGGGDMTKNDTVGPLRTFVATKRMLASQPQVTTGPILMTLFYLGIA